MQRVLINEDYFVDGSPIFIYLGGEWKIEPDTITSGLWVDIAKQHNGSVVYTEHRFFGQSIPIKYVISIGIFSVNLKRKNPQTSINGESAVPKCPTSLGRCCKYYKGPEGG